MYFVVVPGCISQQNASALSRASRFSGQPTMSDHVLANFHVDRLLSNNTNRKTVSVLGWFKDSPEEKAIVVLEKKAFTETSLLEDGYFRKVVRVDEQFINDIYGNYELVPDVDLNSKWGCGGDS